MFMVKTIKRIAVILMALVLMVAATPILASAHKNPLAPDQQEQGFGDPFILKHDGVYYMYGTLVSGTVVWSSKDLVNWEYKGYCLEDRSQPNLYAPEVVYADGLFYMYSSPGGGGHHIYTSASPTGPFVDATGNIGLKFDGTVLRDNDNTLYFITPSIGALMGYYLSDNKTLNYEKGSFAIPASVANAWTEGPTLFKRNGMYYTTYTGNHVWERSYRVEYALSNKVTSGWVEPADNTILLDIEGELNGLGHNSIFIGPDLDTYYIVYHNLYDTPQPKSVRRYSNFDKIVWNGEKLSVLGPTAYEVDDPSLPDFEERFDGKLDKWKASGDWNIAEGKAKATNGTLISKDKTNDVFTAEYNLTVAASSGTAEILFSYENENNYGKAWIDSADKSFKAELIKDGKSVWSQSSGLYNEFAYDALHTVKVQQTADSLNIYLDNVDRLKYEAKGLKGGSIGYAANGANISASFTAFSQKALGSADGDNFMPVPGMIEAVHTTDTAKGFNLVEAAGDKLGYAIKLNAGEKPTYNIHVKSEGTYSLNLYAKSVAAGTKVNILVDGNKAMTATLPEVNDGEYRGLTLRGLKLPEGRRQVSVEVVSGSMELYEIETELTTEVSAISTDCTSRFADDGTVMWKQYEAMPAWTNGELVYADSSNFGKLLTGELGWTDYEIESDITITAAQKTAGFLFRVEHADNGIRAAVDLSNDSYHQGYYLGFNAAGITLEKHNFGDTKVLTNVNYAVENNKTYKVKISAVGDTFKVYINGSEVLSYTDTSYPLLTGRAGVRTNKASVKYDNFSVKPVENSITVETFDVKYGAPMEGNMSGNKGDGDSVGLSDTVLIIIAAAAAVVLIGAVIVIIVVKKKRNK